MHQQTKIQSTLEKQINCKNNNCVYYSFIDFYYIIKDKGVFRKGRSCPEQILSLKLLLQYYESRNKDFISHFYGFQESIRLGSLETIIIILQEYTVDKKKKLIQLTLTNTIS